MDKIIVKNEKLQVSYNNENSFIYVLESVFKILLWKVLSSFYRRGNQFKEVKQHDKWQSWYMNPSHVT